MVAQRLVISSSVFVDFVAHTVADRGANARADECGLCIMPQRLAGQSAEETPSECPIGAIGHSRTARTQTGGDCENQHCFFHMDTHL